MYLKVNRKPLPSLATGKAAITRKDCKPIVSSSKVFCKVVFNNG